MLKVLPFFVSAKDGNELSDAALGFRRPWMISTRMSGPQRGRQGRQKKARGDAGSSQEI